MLCIGQRLQRRREIVGGDDVIWLDVGHHFRGLRLRWQPMRVRSCRRADTPLIRMM